MKNLSIVLVLLSVLVFAPSVYAQLTFERWFGGTGTDAGRSVVQTSDGGYIVGGWTWSFGAGMDDVYLIKTDSLGDTLWTRTYGGTSSDGGYSVSQTSDGGYIIGGEIGSYGAGSKDVYLIKTDANGDTLWTRTYGGTDHDTGLSVAQTSDGGYVITGFTWSYGAGDWDVYLIKTDSLGDTLWTRTYGGTDYDFGWSVAQTSDGGYVVAGHTESFGADSFNVYLVKTDSSGDTLWTRTYGGTDDDWGNSVSQTSDEGYIIAGVTRSYGTGWYDIYLLKTDANGDTIWTRTYGGADDDRGNSVSQTSDGGYIIAGETSSFGAGYRDVYLIKTDSLGDTLWTRTYGGTSSDGGYSVSQTSDGGYIIGGETGSYGAGSGDVYLMKTDSLGIGIQEEKEQRQVTRDVRFTISPNPFMTSTTIHLSGLGHRAQSIELQIFDVSGRKVREISLLPFNFSLGVTWNGEDNKGRALPPGIYFIQLKAGDFTATKKLVLVH